MKCTDGRRNYPKRNFYPIIHRFILMCSCFTRRETWWNMLKVVGLKFSYDYLGFCHGHSKSCHSLLTGFAYEDMCEISPDHRFLAYSIYVMDKGFFTLCVKDLNAGSLQNKPRVDRVDTLAWSKDGHVLFYTVLNNSNRPSRYVMLWFNCN